MSSSNQDFDDENDANYKPPPKESLNQILNKEEEDESLRKYKEQLLGAAAKGVPKTDDPRLVVIQSFGVKFPNNEHGDIIRELDTQQKVDDMKKTPITIKEGTDYQFFVTFKIQHDIVSALRFQNAISKAGITVEKQNHMMGSYAPRAEVYSYKSPVFTAPSGLLARGSYKARTKFVDDDKQTHLDLEYSLSIKKTFEG